MSSFHYTRTRSHERAASPPRLLRHTSPKRQRLLSADDEDTHDDYPYSGAHRPSRALTVRNQPNQLERLNIWTDARKEERCDSGNEDWEPEKQRRRVSFADEADEEREFQRRVAAGLARSRARRGSVTAPARRWQSESDDERVGVRVWPEEMVRRRERCVSADYEVRERERESRRRDVVRCGGEGGEEVETEAERWVRYRRVKKTKTEEWRPLAGWRRV